MSRRVHLARVSLLAAFCVLCAAALDATPAMASSQGFDIYNLSSVTLKLDSVTQFGPSPVLEQPGGIPPRHPRRGDLLAPGEKMHIELEYNLYKLRIVRLDFRQFTPGSSDRSYELALRTGDPTFNMNNQVSLACSASGPYQCLRNGTAAGGTTAKMLDAPGTNITVPATDPAEQARVLQEVCTQQVASVGGTCDFDPGAPFAATRNVGPVSAPVFNCDFDQITVRETIARKIGTENSVESGFKVGFEAGFIFDKVSGEVSFKYGHKWINEDTFTKAVEYPLKKGFVGWVQLLAPVVRVTGDFTLKIGNTTLTLSGVYFDHPDPSKVGNARPRARKATEAECAEEGGVRRLAREDSGVKRLASGGTRLPFSALRLKRSGRGMLRGGPESDVLRGRGNVIILGGGGNDRLIAGPGDALLVGGSGHDVLIGGSGTDTMIDTRGPALVRTGKKTRRRWDYVYVRDGRADDTVICRSRHTIVVADKRDRVRGRCGEVIRVGPIDQPRPPIP